MNRLLLIAVAIAGAFAVSEAGKYYARPSELRRDIGLETQSAFGLARRYEVSYMHCADGTETFKPDAKGFAKSIAGAYRFKFPAIDHDDAIAFAKTARPACSLASLYHLKPTFFASGFGDGYDIGSG